MFVGSLVGIGPMVIGKLLGPSRPDPEKLSAYYDSNYNHLFLNLCYFN